MRRIAVTALLLVLALASFGAEPYEPMKFGIMGGVNSTYMLRTSSSNMIPFLDYSIGVQLHLTPLISLRPSAVLFSQNVGRDNRMDTWDPMIYNKIFAIGGQVDAPFHFLRFADGSIYAGPSFAYLNKTQFLYSMNLSGTQYRSGEYVLSLLSIGAIAGGQYQASKHFGFFLDLGIDFTLEQERNRAYDDVGTKTQDDESKNTFIKMRGATLGAIVYLN